MYKRQELENQRNKNARTVTVTDRPVAEGDTAVIDFEGFVDGAAFEGGKGENHPLELSLIHISKSQHQVGHRRCHQALCVRHGRQEDL